MPAHRPDPSSLIDRNPAEVPKSCQRVMRGAQKAETLWIGPKDAKTLSKEEMRAYELAHRILCHLAVQAPRAHSSGHPGGPLSSFTFAYLLGLRRDPSIDQPLRMSAGHLSVLAYGLQWLLGREGNDARLATPQAIIENFRTPNGLPGHVEAGIGDIPFGTGPLGKGVSNALGAAFGLQYQKKRGAVDVLLADGDSQEGQVMEAFRLASHLKLDNLVVHGDFNDIQLSGLPSQTVAADFAAIAKASGWEVIEVQNGNDPGQVRAAQDLADDFRGKGKPIFLCYYTTMGYGVRLMEHGSNSGTKNYHGTPLSDEEAAEALKDLPPFDELIKEYQPIQKALRKAYDAKPHVATDVPLTWKLPSGYTRQITKEKGAARKDFGATHLLGLMKGDERIVALHADLAGSGGFEKVEKVFPNRCINVGVAEANMYMMAAGMRQTGLLPVTYTFAAFGTNEARANARLIDVNCGHTRCGVLHDCTHAGLSVGEDGETHQERNYLNIPLDHTQVWMTADSNQAGAMAERAMELVAGGHQSVYTFFPRSGHPQILTPDGNPLYGSDYRFDGKMNLVRGAGDCSDVVTVFATGIPIHDAIAAADSLMSDARKISVRVMHVSCIRPLDAAALMEAALETGHLVVAEDHHSEGGLATQIADVIADFHLPCTLRRLGVNQYFPSASDKDLRFMAGLDAESIADVVQDEMRAEVHGGEDAFVSTIYEFIHNLDYSRFRETAQPFLHRLLTQDGYIDTLRAFWAERECPKDRLPSSTDLLERLSES